MADVDIKEGKSSSSSSSSEVPEKKARVVSSGPGVPSSALSKAALSLSAGGGDGGGSSSSRSGKASSSAARERRRRREEQVVNSSSSDSESDAPKAKPRYREYKKKLEDAKKGLDEGTGLKERENLLPLMDVEQIIREEISSTQQKAGEEEAVEVENVSSPSSSASDKSSNLEVKKVLSGSEEGEVVEEEEVKGGDNKENEMNRSEEDGGGRPNESKEKKEGNKSESENDGRARSREKESRQRSESGSRSRRNRSSRRSRSRDSDRYRRGRESDRRRRDRDYRSRDRDRGYDTRRDRDSRRRHDSSERGPRRGDVWSRLSDRRDDYRSRRRSPSPREPRGRRYWDEGDDRKRDRSRDRDAGDRKRKERSSENGRRSPDERNRGSKKRNSEDKERKDKNSDEKEKDKSLDEKDKENEKKRPRTEGNEDKEAAAKVPPAKDPSSLFAKTGGAYIPPAKLRMMQASITDKSSEAYQRLSWEALKKSLNGLINKVSASNIGIVVREILKENVIRGRGLVVKAVMSAQAVSATYTNVFAALIAIINTKFPVIGELVVKRLILQFRRGFRRNNKQLCITSSQFLAHLVNQHVAHEIVILEILALLLQNPSDESVEVAILTMKECGQRLLELSPRGLRSICDRLRNLLHEKNIDERNQYAIETMFQVVKDGFKDHPAVLPEFDLVEEEDGYTHFFSVDEVKDGEEGLNVFKQDPNFLESEEKYLALRGEILGGDSGEESDEDSDEESEEEEDEEEVAMKIKDQTETNLIALRRTIYLTIQSSLSEDEAAHKLLRLEIKEGEQNEIAALILDCCAQERTFEKFFALLAQRFCQVRRQVYVEPFCRLFNDCYNTCHRFETNKLRNVSRFFAHLLVSDSIPWTVLSNIKLTEHDTNSSNRIFTKILFQDMSQYMGLQKFNERLKDPTLMDDVSGLFPRDDPRNTRFAINFFTSIGLGGVTDELREFLKTQPTKKPTAVVPPTTIIDPQSTGAESGKDSSSSSSTSTTSTSSSSTSSSSSDSSSSDSSSSESSSSD